MLKCRKWGAKKGVPIEVYLRVCAGGCVPQLIVVVGRYCLNRLFHAGDRKSIPLGTPFAGPGFIAGAFLRTLPALQVLGPPPGPDQAGPLLIPYLAFPFAVEDLVWIGPAHAGEAGQRTSHKPYSQLLDTPHSPRASIISQSHYTHFWAESSF